MFLLDDVLAYLVIGGIYSFATEGRLVGKKVVTWPKPLFTSAAKFFKSNK